MQAFTGTSLHSSALPTPLVLSLRPVVSIALRACVQK